MPDSPFNPYQSPSAASEGQSGRRGERTKTGFEWAIVLNGLILVAVLASQGVFNRTMQALEMELPFSTTLALGPVLPSMLAGLLLATIAARRLLRNERYRSIWEFLLIILLGTVAGYYVIAVLLPFASWPVSLT